MEKYLFLCAMGINRSATAAFVASRIAETKGLDIKFFYGGIDAFLNELEICPSKELENKLKNYLDKHDKIFVMEDYMMKGILKLGIERRKLECLNILDKCIYLPF